MSIDYGHGDDLYRYKDIKIRANFSSNVWYEGTPQRLLDHLQQQLSTIESYPAPSAETLVQQIATHHHLLPNSAIVTNGATEAFYLIAHAFQNSSVTICTPTFSEYELASKVHNLDITYVNRAVVTQHHFDTPLAFICNPNNPDGFENTVEELSKLVRSYPETCFVIDEAYIDFTPSDISALSLVQKFKNVIIVKSLTKVFCIPGLRLGYLLAHLETISTLVTYKIPWNVNSLALHAGSYIFEHYQELFPDMQQCFEHTSLLKQQLNTLDSFEVLPSNTNYFLVKLQKPESKALKEYLVREHQLLIRDASNFRTLDQYYIRIASQSPEKNNALIKALQQWNS
ncbi:pyridoxal phosphate-dependent aminotransferase [Aquimarina rhabdastrellae]